MNEDARTPLARKIRPAILVLVLLAIIFFSWKYITRREDYRGGPVTTTGTIEAVEVQLGFQVGGKIADIPVREGTRVSAGEVVGRLDSRDLEVKVQMARAEVATARAALVQARANRERATADLARIRELVSQGAEARAQLDTVVAAARVAEAQVHAEEARVRQAEAAVVEAELQLSYAQLRAPEGGEVAERIHLPGETVASGAPVVTIAQTDTVKVHAPVDETKVGAVRPGDRVIVRVYTFDRRTFQGVVTDIEPAGEFATRKDWGARRRDIRTFTVTGRVPNPEHLLKDGMTAEVTIEVASAVENEARAQR